MAKRTKAPDAVGYGKPPRATQFRKGQSGNPKGRRPKDKSLGAKFDRHLRQQVEVTVNGKRQRIELSDAIVRQLLADAARGDNRARALVLKFAEGHATLTTASKRVAQAAAPLDVNEQSILDRFKQQTREQIRREIEAERAVERADDANAAEDQLPINDELKEI